MNSSKKYASGNDDKFHSPDTNNSNYVLNSTRNNNSNVRLPKVCIEPFDGEPLCNPTFINFCEEIIDRNNSLADVEKFYYIWRGLLKGKAKSTIDGFKLTDRNYKEALDLLKERFGDNKLLQASFIDSLLKLKGVSYSRDTKELRILHDNIETYIRNLKSLDITTHFFL